MKKGHSDSVKTGENKKLSAFLLRGRKWTAAVAAAAFLMTGTSTVMPEQYASAVKLTETVQAASTTSKKLVTALDKLIKSQKITSKTNKKTALKKLFTAMSGKSYGYKRAYGFKKKSGWAATYAQEMLSSKKGSCYHYAAAYAYAAKRATNYPVRVCIGTSTAFNAKRWQPHAWVEIKIDGTWYSFDTDAARFSSLRKGKWYMQKSSSLKNKVYKVKSYVNITI